MNFDHSLPTLPIGAPCCQNLEILILKTGDFNQCIPSITNLTFLIILVDQLECNN